MIPAFLSAYTSMGGNSLNIFPALSRLLPNWTVKYSGLSQLPWFRDVFKSFNINHATRASMPSAHTALTARLWNI